MTAVLDTQVPPPAGVREGAFGNATHLVCRACGEKSPLGPFYACMECFGPLEVGYDFPRVTREQIEAGPKSIWRYAPLLPVPSDITTFRSTDPGFTRLVDAGNLAADLGVRKLWVKDDSGNPTHSFKDRVVAVALSAARELGLTVLACPSTGNLANAVAAAAARAGIRSVVMVPSNLEQQKIIASAVYDTTLIAIDGNYDDVNKLASEIAGEEEGWAFVNVNVRPYYAEGSKTLAFEIAEQLGWRLPDQVVVPVASGSQLTKIDKGFGELVKLGLVEDKPVKIFGAQATGCSPVVQAYEAGQDVVAPVRPDTIAKSLAIGNPADGPYVLDVVRRTGGRIADVDDETVVRNIVRLARTEGIFGETAGGVTLGVTARLLAEGDLDPDAETVFINSGDGLKTLDAVSSHVGPKTTIPPRYEAFTDFWRSYSA
ncbi:threonine synthase [Microlunatus sagamiharensis]|uniref:Threonine synthase n=1 Tax=Microlunatus sagamiharensis TaxID=546874 RepID=A0A1H2LG38_9ACTN|nr:threonine synthase [Microlunatus sagamiharensis]SDU79977.1 threonine synthase [Microlunatus sagamiharensis]